MELFVTKNSPYSKLVRGLIYELCIKDRVRVSLAKTRTINSSYYATNPSGRVPYLLRDDGLGMEDSDLICEYLCAIFDSNLWSYPDGNEGLELLRLHGLCRSYIDGLSVWLREIARAPAEQSSAVIAHELERSKRMSEVWEIEINNPLMQGELNRTQLTLFWALEIEKLLSCFNWRLGHPKLIKWHEEISTRPSLKMTNDEIL